MKSGVTKKINCRGVTLVELLVYLGISMIMLVVLSELFAGIMDESTETQNYSAVQTDGRYIMGRIRYQLGNASSVTAPGNLGESLDRLTLTVDGTTYNYHVSGDKLYLDDGTNDVLISHLNTTISGVLFTRTGNADGRPVILIEFTSSMGRAGTGEFETQTFSGAGGLR